MRIFTGRRRLTYLELVLVMTVAATLATLLFPMLSHAQADDGNAQAQRATCNSNIRQIALAIQMYAQDNMGQYPGIDDTTWVSKVSPYLGNASAMFECPADAAAAGGDAVSYGLSGLLIRENGTGVKESQVMSPSEVGAICDAAPLKAFPNGGVVGGGGLRSGEIKVQPEPRHDGLLVGFCDGHAKYYQGDVNPLDEANGVARSMYHASPLGLIDNPAAMLPAGAGIPGLAGTVAVGGEYATNPMLMAAARVCGDYYTAGFKGQFYSMGRPQADWVWGTVSSGPEKIAPKAMAYDALCIVVAKGSRIPTLPAYANTTYAVTPAAIKTLFEIGYRKDYVQVYHLPGQYCNTNAYVKKVIGNTNWGIDAVEVANDAEMIEKVANDPWGIGYCSSAFADPDRITILSPIIGENIYVWPRASAEMRWVMPSFAESDWPWKRSLDVTTSPGQLASGIATALHTGPFVKKGLYKGPLFTWGYWPGNY